MIKTYSEIEVLWCNERLKEIVDVQKISFESKVSNRAQKYA